MIKQRKKGRPPSENPMVHTAVVLPQDLLKRLRADAERSKRGLSTEIRQRLQWTYDLERLPHDPETSDLIERIKRLTNTLAGDLGKKWYEQQLRDGSLQSRRGVFLARYHPEGDEEYVPIGFAGDDDPPDVVGRTHARLIMGCATRQ